MSGYLGARQLSGRRAAPALVILPLLRALEQEEGRRRYLAGPLRGSCRAKPWRGRRLDYITYRGVPGGLLSPEVEQVTFSTALAGLTDHLAVGLRLRVSMPS